MLFRSLTFGDCTSGAAGDIKQATHIARQMVTEWGMSERIGMVNVSDKEEHLFVGRDMFKPREVSEETSREIDQEVRRLIDESYARARTILTENQDKLIALAEALLEYETLDAEQVTELVETGKLTSPPRRPPPPSAPADSEQPSESKAEDGADTQSFPTPGIGPEPAKA